MTPIMPPEIVERHLKVAERHLIVGETCIARQKAVIARLECSGHHPDLLREAVRLLAKFMVIQSMHLADRDRLISELDLTTTDHRIAQGQFGIAQQRKAISQLDIHGEDGQGAKQQLALMEGMQAALVAHRDRLEDMSAEDAEEMGRMHAALLSLLRIGMADTSARLSS